VVVVLPSESSAPSPREVQALAVVEETGRLLDLAQHLLNTPLVVDVQGATEKAAVRHAQSPAG
jgi:hypothetical protein